MRGNSKSDFPIFNNNPSLVYLDSASSTQKPDYVINKTTDYIRYSYSNIGRGIYSIAEESDEYYYGCKKKIAELIHSNANEIFFSHNATYCINAIGLSLIHSDILTPGSEIILSISEHHANILIRQQLAKQYGLTLKWLNLNTSLEFDLIQLKALTNKKTKLICLTACSNVLGIKNNLNEIKSIVGKECLFLIDASQAIPNYPINVKSINCDFLVWSAHKFLSYSGLGIGYIKHELIQRLKPGLLGGGMVEDVSTEEFTLKNSIEKFEPGTPNIIGIVSLYHAIDYWKSIGGYEYRTHYEKTLIDYFIGQYAYVSDKITLLSDINSVNNYKANTKIGIFSFIPNLSSGISIQKLSQTFFDHNICVRSGGHCAYPLAKYLGIENGSIRVSLYIYNTIEDIDRFFDTIKKIT